MSSYVQIQNVLTKFLILMKEVVGVVVHDENDGNKQNKKLRQLLSRLKMDNMKESWE